MKNKKQRWRNLCPVRQMGIQYERKIKRYNYNVLYIYLIRLSEKEREWDKMICEEIILNFSRTDEIK